MSTPDRKYIKKKTFKMKMLNYGTNITKKKKWKTILQKVSASSIAYYIDGKYIFYGVLLKIFPCKNNYEYYSRKKFPKYITLFFEKTTIT